MRFSSLIIDYRSRRNRALRRRTNQTGTVAARGQYFGDLERTVRGFLFGSGFSIHPYRRSFAESQALANESSSHLFCYLISRGFYSSLYTERTDSDFGIKPSTVRRAFQTPLTHAEPDRIGSSRLSSNTASVDPSDLFRSTSKMNNSTPLAPAETGILLWVS
jgi:hypothetical protein